MKEPPLDLQRRLTLKQLRMVSILGEELHLSRTAERMHTSQPALSRALADLEAAVQRPLFHRTTKRVQLTPSGHTMLRHANRILAELDAAETDLTGLDSAAGSPLVIGVHNVFSQQLLAQAIIRTRAALPGTLVRVRLLDQMALYEQLLDNRIGLMLAHAELRVDLNRVDVQTLYEESSVIVCGPQHRLAKRRRIGWAELANEAWVLPPLGTPIRPKIDRLLSVHRLPNHRALDVETDSHVLALQLLRRAPLVWSIAERLFVAYAEAAQLVRLNAPDALVRGPICCMTLRGHTPTPAMRIFLDELTLAAQRPGS